MVDLYNCPPRPMYFHLYLNSSMTEISIRVCRVKKGDNRNTTNLLPEIQVRRSIYFSLLRMFHDFAISLYMFLLYLSQDKTSIVTSFCLSLE